MKRLMWQFTTATTAPDHTKMQRLAPCESYASNVLTPLPMLRWCKIWSWLALLLCVVDWWHLHVAQQQFSDFDQEMDGTVHCKWNTMTIEEKATIQAPKVVYLYLACHGPPQGGRFLCRLRCNHTNFGSWWKVWRNMLGGRSWVKYLLHSRVCFLKATLALWPDPLVWSLVLVGGCLLTTNDIFPDERELEEGARSLLLTSSRQVTNKQTRTDEKTPRKATAF
jgi:hypothetical protein